MEKRYLRKIARVFETLQTPLRLADGQGQCLIPQNGEALPAVSLPPGMNHRAGEWLIRPMDTHPPLLLFAAADAPGAGDVLCLADALVQGIINGDTAAVSHDEVYRQALCRELVGADLLSQAGEHQIPLQMERCVLLFQLEKAETVSAYGLLNELAPMPDTDVLLEMSHNTVALVKDMTDVDGLDELKQFASAVAETLLEEAAQTVAIGIGESKPTLARLGESYAEARTALEVGRAFLPKEEVYVYRRLMLERFLTSVPKELAMRYHSLLFNGETAKLFNDEMLQTIEMFFHKDLNLSDTARQLFIHRNTLVYRLDKVQRQTGLDLRRFDDAVTFQILYKLQKCGMEDQIY